jgi:hypothetical protein
MANWTDMGHAMRRRMGAPSNHHEATGASMSNRTNLTPEEIIASAEHTTSPRRYMGMAASAANVTATSPLKGKLMPKNNKQAADPTITNKANRKNVSAGNAAQSERMGARYSIGVKFPKGTNIESASTMGSARMVPSVSGRQAPNFDAGMSGPY